LGDATTGGERFRSGAEGDLHQQPVALLRDRLDVARVARFVAERLAQLPDRVAQHLFGDERLLPPDFADQPVLGNDVGAWRARPDLVSSSWRDSILKERAGFYPGG
jgi:hypothetical protein